RRSDNDLVVDEASVSRRHALIMETASGYVVRDLNSTNGTFVNREKIGGNEWVLQHGDRIRMGGSKTVFVFQQDASNTLKLQLDELNVDNEEGEKTREEPKPKGKEKAKSVRLGKKAAQLLKFLQSKEGTPVSRDDIIRGVWPELAEGDEANRAISRAVEEIRHELEEDASQPERLMTLGEFGYILL
ncbi:MAG: FHA domain-containing protein, partial [SAR202 cluster bacterium]|nr:FHA domain-containing protein [SAR202 cluster bacterium]